MDKTLVLAKQNLMNCYARYFVNDFTHRVMDVLSASNQVDPTYLSQFVDLKIDAQFAASDQGPLESVNPINRFIHECAEFATENFAEDPQSLAAWNEVKEMPSVFHDEIQQIVYQSAELYLKTLEGTLRGVVARDVVTASSTIAQAVQDRISLEETGGTLHQFGWGILSDGRWLNGALMRAFDLAKIFRPGEQISEYYTQEAFSSARTRNRLPLLTDEQKLLVDGQLNMLIASGDELAMESLNEPGAEADLVKLLFAQGDMTHHLDYWEKGLKDPILMIKVIDRLSTLARVLPAALHSARKMEDPTLISDFVLERLESANDTVILCLAGFEALRETKFENTVILGVTGQGIEPTVDVFVNADMMNAYKAEDGEELDLIRFGLHLDPRKGIPSQSAGWNLEYIKGRRAAVIPNIVAQNAERLETLRANDAAVIQNAVVKTVGDVVTSYLDIRGDVPMPKDLNASIHTLARQVSSQSSEINLNNEIFGILVSAMGDPFVKEVSDRLQSHAVSGEEVVQRNAATLTIAETAIADAVGYITARNIVE